MAEKLEEFPGRNRYTKYPWTTWFDGSIWSLKSGVDYTGRDESMRNQFYIEAKRRGGKVKVPLFRRWIRNSVLRTVAGTAQGEPMSETPTAYSVEEHMFNQDEIQKRHQQQPDQQRSEQQASKADIERLIYKYGDACHYENISTERIARDALRDAIAERDATIAALLAEIERLTDLAKAANGMYEVASKMVDIEQENWMKMVEERDTLQARVAELEAAINKWWRAIKPGTLKANELQMLLCHPRPTTEK